jgi:hypothetical protein
MGDFHLASLWHYDASKFLGVDTYKFILDLV